MDLAWIIPLLALITILVALVFAIWSKEATERRKARDKDAYEKSSLAADGDSHSTAS